jgi:SOS response associated peptidase (SRAP)
LLTCRKIAVLKFTVFVRHEEKPKAAGAHFAFDKLGVQALLVPAFDHVTPGSLNGRMQSYHSVTWVSASLLLVWTTSDDYICGMCGRVIQSSGPLRYAIVDGMDVRDSRVHNYPPRWNAAPSQELLVIRRNHQTGDVSLDPLRWGLIPHWCMIRRVAVSPSTPNARPCGTFRHFATRTAGAAASCRSTASLSGKAIKGRRTQSP